MRRVSCERCWKPENVKSWRMGHESDTWLQTTLASCIDIAYIAHFAKLKHGLNTPSMIHPNSSRPFDCFFGKLLVNTPLPSKRSFHGMCHKQRPSSSRLSTCYTCCRIDRFWQQVTGTCNPSFYERERAMLNGCICFHEQSQPLHNPRCQGSDLFFVIQLKSSTWVGMAVRDGFGVRLCTCSEP